LLRENYQLNDYYDCEFAWNGQRVKAAVRSRGNGSRNPFKPGLKVSFTKPKDGKPFLGQSALVLANMAQDPTMLKYRLSFGLFAKADIPTPRLTYARVSINGRYWGVYQLIEEIDSAFLTERFGQKDGYLYEYAWVDDYRFEQRGEGTSNDYFPEPFEPKNNSKNPNPALLMALVEAVNKASDAAFHDEISQCVDTRQLLTYLAVEVLTGERDGFLGSWGMNGFYLYNFKGTTKFTILPWDKDWSFFRWDRHVLEGAEQNVLVRRLLQDREFGGYFRAELERCARIAGGAGGWLESEARGWHNVIYKSAMEDPNRLEGAGTMANEYPKLIEFVQRRGPEVIRQLGL
jgi:spore coat protein CotH